MGLAARTRWTLRRYWADRLGVPPTAFGAAGVAVGAADGDGIQLFRCDGALVIGVPDSLRAGCERRAAALETRDLDDPDAVRAWLGRLDDVDRVVGPTYYGYTDRERFDPVESDARVLTAADAAAHEAFRAAIPEDEWAQGGPEFTPDETVGHFVQDELVATAGYDIWDGVIAHLAVVTHPEYRNAGYGRAVVSRATDRALAAGFLPQYRTSDAWPWSVALARGLGFARFATAYLGVETR